MGNLSTRQFAQIANLLALSAQGLDPSNLAAQQLQQSTRATIAAEVRREQEKEARKAAKRKKQGGLIRTAGRVAGTAIGFAVGGPPGAAIGSQIGAGVGGTAGELRAGEDFGTALARSAPSAILGATIKRTPTMQAGEQLPTTLVTQAPKDESTLRQLLQADIGQGLQQLAAEPEIGILPSITGAQAVGLSPEQVRGFQQDRQRSIEQARQEKITTRAAFEKRLETAEGRAFELKVIKIEKANKQAELEEKQEFEREQATTKEERDIAADTIAAQRREELAGIPRAQTQEAAALDRAQAGTARARTEKLAVETEQLEAKLQSGEKLTVNEISTVQRLVSARLRPAIEQRALEVLEARGITGDDATRLERELLEQLTDLDGRIILSRAKQFFSPEDFAELQALERQLTEGIRTGKLPAEIAPIRRDITGPVDIFVDPNELLEPDELLGRD